MIEIQPDHRRQRFEFNKPTIVGLLHAACAVIGLMLGQLFIPAWDSDLYTALEAIMGIGMGLFMANVIATTLSIAGVIPAYAWRIRTYDSWENSHYRRHIRTFWCGLTYGIACAGLLLFILATGVVIDDGPTPVAPGMEAAVTACWFGLTILSIGYTVWFAGRLGIALRAAQRRQPLAASWLW